VIEYEIVDMFAESLFTGSPLGVVAHADGLSDAEMGAIAAELNVTETAFVFPPDSPDTTYRVRVFTPSGESPYGGHSSVGTAATLVRRGAIPPGPVVQECGGAQQFLTAESGRATLADASPAQVRNVDPAPLAAAVGLTVRDLADAPARMAGFAYLPVQEGAIATATPDFALMSRAKLPALCLVAWDPASRRARTRLFAPGFGIPEDPACAPVAIALGVWLVDGGLLPTSDGTHEFAVRQGAEAGRPARLDCTVTVEHGRAVNGTTTGQVLPVLRGTVTSLG
jgi:trans-2,3-dihydro-3-hydroxyanthranilate isomerase